MARVTITCIVRRFCLDCQGNSAKAVHECADKHCALWEYREPTSSPTPDSIAAGPSVANTNTAGTTSPPVAGILPAEIGKPVDTANPVASLGNTSRKTAQRAFLRAVRRHCMLCATCRADVRSCAARECGLWSYRFGVYPETYRAVRKRFVQPKTLSLF